MSTNGPRAFMDGATSPIERHNRPTRMAQRGALLVIGSGPGVGAHVAACFAHRGFDRIILMSRNLRRLHDDALIVRTMAANAVIDVMQIDLTETEEIEAILDDVETRLDGVPIECIFFNAARAQMSELLQFSVSELRRDLNITTVSLYAVINWAVPRLLQIAHTEAYKPTLLVTNGTIRHFPSPEWFSLAACRAAQMNLLQSCAQAYGSRGIHCAILSIQNIAVGDGLVCQAPVVAEQAWRIFSQTDDQRDVTVPTVIEVFANA